MIDAYGHSKSPFNTIHRSISGFLSRYGSLEKLGLSVVLVYCIYWITPGQYAGSLRVAYIALGGLFLYVCAVKRAFPTKVSPAIVFLFLIYLWGVFCSVYAEIYLGRNEGLGRVYWYGIEHSIPFFVASCLVALNPDMRRIVIGMIFITFSLSCFFGLLQFMRIPPVIALSRLYTYKSIDNWDSGGGIRAIGLTWHPRILAIQGIFCLAVSLSHFLNRESKTKYLVFMVVFSTCIVASQARQYIPALGLIWIYILYRLNRSNPKVAAVMMISLACVAMVGVMFAGRRLSYMFQSSSLSEDASYNYRADNNWIQSKAIYEQLPLTGIGPDRLMFMGPNSDFHDKWTQGRLMESAYRLFLAMYGLPGLILLILFLCSLIYQASVNLAKSRDPDSNTVGMVLLFVGISIAISCYASNVFDEYQSIPVLMMLSGLILNRSRVTRLNQSESISMSKSIYPVESQS
jgi:hypothetical protein